VVYKSKIEKQQVNPSSIVKERWHAVSIVGASDACLSATELRARRFLPQDAPRLPMLTMRVAVELQVCLSPLRGSSGGKFGLPSSDARRGVAGASV